MTSVPLTRTVDEIPDSMKRLAAFIARGFYGPEHGIMIDLLKRNVCMKEDEIKTTLKLDVKQLRAIMVTLKKDLLIKERQMAVEKDGRNVKVNYYFINYRSLVNVTKYKLDHIRKKLEAEEKTATNRASYRCETCTKPFSDLDIGQLMDFATGEMLCYICRGKVIEDPQAAPSQDSRSLMAKFNEQMQPLFGLLQELDGVQLAAHLLEPAPPAGGISADSLNAGKSNGPSAPGFGMNNFNGRRPQFELFQQQDFQVNIEGKSGEDDAKIKDSKQPKEVPIWLQNTTVPGEGERTEEEQAAAMAADGSGGLPPLNTNHPVVEIHVPSLVSPNADAVDDKVAAALRAHEADLKSPTQSHKSDASTEESSSLVANPSTSASAGGTPAAGTSSASFSVGGGGSEGGETGVGSGDDQTDGHGDHRDEEEESDEDFEEVEEEVSVGGETMPLSQVLSDPSLIERMSAEEKSAYIEATQRAMQEM